MERRTIQKQQDNTNMNTNGCAWGRETRIMVANQHEATIEIKEMISRQGKQLNALTLQQAGKPSWVVTIMIATLCTLCGSMAIYILTHASTVHPISTSQTSSITKLQSMIIDDGGIN